MNVVTMHLLADGSRRWLEKILDAIGPVLAILVVIAVFLIQILIISVIIYIAGLMVVGGRKATFSDAFKISLLGTVLGGLVSAVISLFVPLIGLIAYVLIWLALIKQYFETGWLNAFAIAILAIIVAIVLFVIIILILAVPLTLLELFKSGLGLFMAFA